MRIAEVENATGEQRFASLCHFIHMKAGQVLDQAGYRLVSDDLLSAMPVSARPEMVETMQQPAAVLALRLRSVREHTGGTLNIAVFSIQEKSVEVEVGARFISADGRTVYQTQGKGRATKGAWGVIAGVNREAMLDDQGFWALDNSMIGVAAVRAVVHALEQLAPEQEALGD